jgi:YidC/Oxa1 family membrane protein insertase
MLETASIIQPLVNLCHDVLRFWHGVSGSWGIAIILLTFTVRLAILPLTFSSVKSMQKIQVLQPEMNKIRERYKDDKQRMNQEIMKFYQENKVNPLGSCLPLALQLPFFISLFSLLRSAGFKADIAADPGFLIIPDMSAKLTGQPVVLGVMIVLYVGTQLIASLITTVGGDKNQQRIMLALPFFFVPVIYRFPAGLILYWVTTNVWTIGQQLVVRKLYPRPDVLKDVEKDHAQAEAEAEAESAPAHGKPAASTAAVVADGGGNGDGASSSPPPPRKKKRRSGRRR